MSISKPPSNLKTSASITYRNAIYQGHINQQNQTRNDFGIVYCAKTHQFIVCNNWHSDNLQGECLFFNDHKQYIYGPWINNQPQGFNVFRFDQVILMAVFNRGKLTKNSRVLVIFQKYNLAAVLLVLNESQKLDDLQLQVFSKSQVFSPQDVNLLFKQCNWPNQYFLQHQTLIKYISHKLIRPPPKYQTPSKNQPKLRLIENKYYRFGFDQGLAIVFDQDFYRVSVGNHSKNKINSFGIVFDQKPKPLAPYNKPDQGKIIKITPQKGNNKTPAKKQNQKSQNPQPNLKINLLMGVNFCNKFFKNPSKPYVDYIKNIISLQTIKKIVAGSLTTRRMYEQSLDFSKIEENPNNSSDLFDKQMRKPNVLAPVTHAKRQTPKSEHEKLTGDRLRLEAIKKEIYDSLQKRKSPNLHGVSDYDYSRDIIHKEIVGRRYNYAMETPSRTEQSKSRRRIFEQSQKNMQILRDFTPARSEPSLTPFKTKMKNRIFNGASTSKHNSNQGANNHSYNSYGENRQRNHRKMIFENEETQINDKNVDRYEQHGSNKFSSHHSKGRELRSKGKIRDIRGREEQEMDRQDVRPIYNNRPEKRHVTFLQREEEQGGLMNSGNHNLNRDTFDSGNNNNVQYVPIDPVEQKHRKRSIHNNQSHKQSRESHRNQEKSPYSKGSKPQYNYEAHQMQKRLTPKSKYYLQEKSSRNMQAKSFTNQNQSKKGQYLSPQDIQTEGYKKQYQRQQNHQRPYEQQKQTSKYFRRERREEERENGRERERQREKQKERQRKQNNFIYQDDTFKQTTLPQEFDSINLLRERQTVQEDRHKRSTAFKNSNQVYLEQLKQKYSPVKSTTQTYGNYNRTHQQSTTTNGNKTMPYMLPFNQNNRSNSKDNYNNSYRVKHMMKKSMQKQISRSPDKIRCYGKNMNNPYIEASPKYAKQGTYMMSYNNYESPQMLSRNDTYNIGMSSRNPQRGRLF